MNKAILAAVFAAGLTAGSAMPAASGEGGTKGADDRYASVDIACVPKGGFLVTVIFYITGHESFLECKELGYQQIGVWNDNYIYHRFHHCWDDKGQPCKPKKPKKPK